MRIDQVNEEHLQALNLHESVSVEGYEILRVPGGWIYYCYLDEATTAIFVPEPPGWKE